MSNRQQRRMSGVPQRSVVHERYRNESEDDDFDNEVRVIKVIDLVAGASFWSVIIAILSFFYDEFDGADILNPIVFAIMFLFLVPIHKVDL